MDQVRTYKWIQDRLRELHSGSLSEQDRLRLVEIAKEDPFVADALEGYQDHPDVSHTEHLDILARKIILQKRERRRWLIPNLTVTAIAASLILIIGTWAVITRMDKKDEAVFVFVAPDSLTLNDTVKNDIAVNEEQATGESISSAPISKDEPSAALSRKEVVAKSESDQKQSQPASASKSSEITQPVGGITKNETPALYSAETYEDKIDVVEPEPPPPTTEEISPAMRDQSITYSLDRSKSKVDEGYYANQMDPDLMARRVTGRVVDEENYPLIGAYVRVRNSNVTSLGTVSDLNGWFELFLPLPETEVEVSMTGFSPTTSVLRQGEEDVNIILKSGIVLNEAVITTSISRSKSEKSIASGADVAASEDDTVTFIEYLKANSKFLLRENFYSPGKDVTVEFTVPSNGKPEKVKILSSSGDKAMDDEAIRLIKKGPGWECVGNVYPCVMYYTFYFQ